MNKPQRPLTRQNFFAYVLACNVTAVPLSSVVAQSQITALYTAFALSIPVGGNRGIWGDVTVSTAGGNGVDITPGVVQVWPIVNGRQLYELQAPLIDGLRCDSSSPWALAIPFTVWDITQIFVATTAAQNVGVMLFQESFV